MSLHGMWRAFNDPNLDGWHQLAVHARLSLTALVLACVIGLVLGIVSAHAGRRAAFAVSAVANLGRTVPTFALLALVVAVSTIGEGPALVGLVALGVPPVLLNVVTGIREVDRGAVDAARGMGFTRLGVLTRVELPMALPLTLTGVRVSAIQIIATAALAAAVGANGLGVLILSGLANSDNDVLLAGAVPTALLALGVGAVLAGVERFLTPRGLRLARGGPYPGRRPM